jgi:nucleoside-diphosphate-sugar epimerase
VASPIDGIAGQTAQRGYMTPERSHAKPILVTGAAGAVGSIGRNLTEMLVAKGHKVRALVRREDERAEALRDQHVRLHQVARR